MLDHCAQMQESAGIYEMKYIYIRGGERAPKNPAYSRLKNNQKCTNFWLILLTSPLCRFSNIICGYFEAENLIPWIEMRK